MALSASVLRSTRGLSSMRPQITNAAVVYPGGYVGLTSGRIGPWTGAAGQRPLGFVSEQLQVLGSNADGNTGNTSATPPTACSVAVDGGVLDNIAVTGLAGTVADNDLDVWATADSTFTLTAQAAPNAQPIGFVVQFKTSSLADVYFYSKPQLNILSRSSGALSAGRAFRGTAAAASIATAGAGSPSAANILTGTIIRDCTGASRTDTLPTAALMVAALQAALAVPLAVGDCIDFLYVNGSDPVTEIITIAEGSGGGWDTNQTAVSRTILGTCSKLIRMRFTNVTASSEAYVLYA